MSHVLLPPDQLSGLLSCFSQDLSCTGEPAAGPSITQVISQVLNRGGCNDFLQPALFVLTHPGQSTWLVLLQGCIANAWLTHCLPGSQGTQCFLNKAATTTMSSGLYLFHSMSMALYRFRLKIKVISHGQDWEKQENYGLKK